MSKLDGRAAVVTGGNGVGLAIAAIRRRECASVALFLGSDESSYMTRCDLVVDGGATQL